MGKTYTSSKGEVLTLKAVSQFKIDSMRAAKAEIEVPIYRVKTVGGDEQEFPLDETIAKNKDRLDEWNEYIEKKKAAESAYAKRFTDFLIWEGVDVDVPGPDSDWEKTNTHFGIATPSDPVDRKTLYVYNELLGPAEDIGDLIAEILSASRLVNEEAAAKLRTTFRAGAQRTANPELPALEGSVERKEPDVEPS